MTSRKSIKYKDGFKYQLVEQYADNIRVFPEKDINTDFVTLTLAGTILINKGYAWDGPSGPTFDTKSFMRGSLVHDALYQLIRLGHLDADQKDVADRLLREMCIEDGMSSIRAWWVYNAVRKFGGAATMPSGEAEIQAAP
jgi:hypothetical protein